MESLEQSLHAKYSPSQLPRIIGCPGSTTVHEQQESTLYAIEGTHCHTITADHLLESRFKLDKYHAVFNNFDDEDRDDLEDAVQECLDYAFGLITQYDDPHVFVEHPVTLAGYIDEFGCPDLIHVAGTSDLLIFVPTLRRIHVVDWKFGAGIEVYPTSEQIMAYGAGALKNSKVMKNFDEVFLHVAQPRLYSGEIFKVHQTTPTEIFSWIKKTLVPALELTQLSNPPFNPSEKACQWCSAKVGCGARHALALKTAEEVFKVHAELPNLVKLEELQEFLDRARDIGTYIKDIEGFIVQTLKNGKPVPRLKLVEGRSNRKWHDQKAFINWASERIPDVEIFDPKLLGPAKVEKLVKKYDVELFKSTEFTNHILKPPGKPTLVTDKDPRPAINFQDATAVFGDFVE